MLNIYRLHAEPKILNGYHIRHRISPELAYDLIMDGKLTSKKLVQEAENVIATSAFFSFSYANDFLENRFELGEDAIITSPEETLYYVRHVIRGRWEKGESILLQHKYYAEKYLIFLKQKRLHMK